MLRSLSLAGLGILAVLVTAALSACATGPNGSSGFDMGYGYTADCPTKNMACSPYVNQ
jgi:hypothetical protein